VIRGESMWSTPQAPGETQILQWARQEIKTEGTDKNQRSATLKVKSKCAIKIPAKGANRDAEHESRAKTCDREDQNQLRCTGKEINATWRAKEQERGAREEAVKEPMSRGGSRD